MNTFDKKLNEQGCFPLIADSVSTLQVNIGYKCNLKCTHCHVDASPDRKEEMSLSTLSTLLEILRENDHIKTVDITGGSPELNPHFMYFIKSCIDIEKKVIVRTNLAIYSEKGMNEIPVFLAKNKIKIVASLPCYSEAGVDRQRGHGTYNKAIYSLKILNSLGYGKDDPDLELDIMFNPAGAEIAPDQHTLEKEFKTKLKNMHGVTFNHLIALSNMPIGRLGNRLSVSERKEYLKILEDKFNPDTIDKVMCKYLVNVSPDGMLFDCDFWQMLDIPVNNRGSNISDFDYDTLRNREIVTHHLCLLCTAGAGASCSGALT